jgi:hypothetical protein
LFQTQSTKNYCTQRLNGLWKPSKGTDEPWTLTGGSSIPNWRKQRMRTMKYNFFVWQTWSEIDCRKISTKFTMAFYVLRRLCTELYFRRVWGETCCTSPNRADRACETNRHHKGLCYTNNMCLWNLIVGWMLVKALTSVSFLVRNRWRYMWNQHVKHGIRLSVALPVTIEIWTHTHFIY